jgi:hypothetical protein
MNLRTRTQLTNTGLTTPIPGIIEVTDVKPKYLDKSWEVVGAEVHHPVRLGHRACLLIVTGSQEMQIPTGHLVHGQFLYGSTLSNTSTATAPSVFGYSLLGQTAASNSVFEGDAFDVMYVPNGPQAVAKQELKSTIEALLNLGTLLDFEDGLENEFTIQLDSLVKKYGSVAMEELAKTLFLPGVHLDVVTQTLLCLGRIEDETSYLARSWVLQRGLFSSSAKVRDAAAVGISSLADALAKDSLEVAIRKEPVRSLKADMQRVLSYLQTVK